MISLVTPQIKGLIFDCDGTLADTLPMHYAAWECTLAELDLPFPEDFFDEFNGVTTVHILELLGERNQVDIDIPRAAELKEALVAERISTCDPIEPVVRVAKHFHGRLPMSVASGGIRLNVDGVIDVIGMNGAFDAVYTASDDLPGKPNPDIFLAAAKRMGVAPETCLVFEDGAMGFEAARRANMPFVDVREYL